MLYTSLLTVHSWLRYAVLILVVFTLLRSFAAWMGNKPFTASDRKVTMFALMSAHIQFVIGLILYIISPIVHTGLSDMGAAMKDSTLRFWTVEHIGMMLVAIILITIGYSSAKRGNPATGHKKIAIFFLIGILLVVAAIPWPFSANPRPWF